MKPTYEDINKLYMLKPVVSIAWGKVIRVERFIGSFKYLDDKIGYDVCIAKAWHYCRKVLDMMKDLVDFFDHRSEEKYTGKSRKFIILLERGCKMLKQDVEHHVIEPSLLRSTKDVTRACGRFLCPPLRYIGRFISSIDLDHYNSLCNTDKKCYCDWCRRHIYTPTYDKNLLHYGSLDYPAIIHNGKVFWL